MLWSETELATVVDCLGVSSTAASRMTGESDAPGGERIRVGGATQLVEMTNAQMCRDLGLCVPLERLVVRRAIQHMLTSDRRANAFRGRGLHDVMDNAALRKYIVPLDRLTLKSTVSQGGFGIVYRGSLRTQCGDFMMSAQSEAGGNRHRSDDDSPKKERMNVAAKEMLGDSRARVHELLKEAHVMASLRHKNICRFVGICAGADPRGRRFILSELLHCSLFDLVHRPDQTDFRRSMDILLTLKLSEGICSGLTYIHARSLVHADLKSSNILIDLTCSPEDDYQPVPRICDFGHAAVRTSSSPHDRLCTPHWAAPEVLRNEGLGPPADMFSVGVLLWEMLAKRVPHHDLGFGHVLATVGWAGAKPDMERLPSGLIPEVRRLLNDLLRFTPTERPRASVAHRRFQRLPRALRGRAVQAVFGFLGFGN